VRSKRNRLALFGVLALALSVTVGITAGAVEAKKVKTFSSQVSPNAAIPDDPGGAGPSIPLVSTINVGKKYKQRKVADVNVTGIQTTGSAATAAADLEATLTGPTGRTIHLFAGVGGQNLGPWTLNDDTKTSICDDTALTCSNPNATLLQPFAGTSNLKDTDDDVGVLSEFDLTRMKGTWTLTIWDDQVGGTSTLNSWGLQIKPLKLKPPTVEVE
jgi:hypothetical protein